MKTCSKCGFSGRDELFVPPRKGRVVNNHKCKKCTSITNHLYYLNNKRKILIRTKKYAEDHRDLYRNSAIGYYRRNTEKCRANNRRWIKENLDHLSMKARIRHKQDANYALRSRLRSRIHSALKRRNSKKSNPTMHLVGCDRETLFRHLESLFRDGMNWENKGKWHVDHIVPLIKFDLTKKSEQLLAFNYRNLQPLWASENLSKGCAA